jgi:REP element-mobilizing transposase RayT
MARPLRLEFPGALYHVTARGDRRDAIYLEERDQRFFVRLLGQTCERMNWECYAYCLMTNHYHLVVETADGNLSRGMRHLNGVYTQKFNFHHDQVGHVFQGRYQAILVDRDAYLLELARYVVLNPVRAGLARSAGQWPWSSYRATVALSPCPDWLAAEKILRLFGQSGPHSIAAYSQFIEAGVSGTPVWNDLKHQLFLGDDAFVERMKRRINAAVHSCEIPREQREPGGQTIASFAVNARNQHAAMAQAYLLGGHTMKAIADHFGVHYSTVSRAVNTYEDKYV